MITQESIDRLPWYHKVWVYGFMIAYLAIAYLIYWPVVIAMLPVRWIKRKQRR